MSENQKLTVSLNFNMKKLKEDILKLGYNENDKDWLMSYNDQDGMPHFSILKAITITEECKYNNKCNEKTMHDCDMCIKKKNGRCYDSVAWFDISDYIESDIPRLFE